MLDAVPAVSDVLTIASLTFDPATGKARSPDGGWHVPPDQGAILLHLLLHRGEAVPAADLARVMWPHRNPKEKPGFV